MRLLFVHHRGVNLMYFFHVFNCLPIEHEIVNFAGYVDDNFDQSNYDIIVYQTFPDSRFPHKFNVENRKKGDQKFLEFKGLQILLDSHDDGDLNSFKRFGNIAIKIPRIKHSPSYDYLKKFNVIMIIPSNFKFVDRDPFENEQRDIIIHNGLRIGKYPHRIREQIREILHRSFPGETNLKRISPNYYQEFLYKVKISINAPGFGPCSDSFFEAIQGGSVVVTEESINKYKLLPYIDLVSGEDYISFNLRNLSEKLYKLIRSPDMLRRIRKSAYTKFLIGYDVQKSTDQFLKFLKENVK